MSNPYAPPEDRPRQPGGEQSDAPTQDQGRQPSAHEAWQHGSPTPVRSRVPTDPAGAARAARIARAFALTVLASVLVSMMRLPYSLAAGALGLVALGIGVWALVVAGRAHVRGTLPVMLTAGLGIALLWSMATAAPLFALQTELDRQACLDGALTVSARTACEADYRNELNQLRDRLGQRG
ncbi:hypothetical protein [Cellulomonas sp. URHE0023]|uniref:hypothetical protein n=1 Tax=Cellulomonas sp. URHE0023 TaxID=1380354 RepID=UPI0012DDC9F5|nr:hypothetical protein [Cellulomonas sp. URHE0023]